MTTQETETTDLVETKIFSVQDLRTAEVLRLEEVAKKGKEAIDIEIIDKATLKAVHDARIILQKNRTTILKSRLAFTAGLTQAQKDAIQIEKDLIAIISPTELALEEKEKAYEAEQARIKKEKEEAEQANIQKRFDALNEIEAVFIPGEVAKMSDEGFPFFYDMHKKKYEQKLEERRIAEEKRLQEQAEIDRKNAEAQEELRKQKEEQDKIAEANRIESERIQKENARIAEEQAQKAKELADKEKAIKDKEEEQKRQEEAKKAQDEAIEKAKKEEAERIENERIQKEEEEAKKKDFMEKEARYIAWLSDNGVNDETRAEFTTQVSKEKVVLYRQVSVFYIDEKKEEKIEEK